MAAGGQPMRGCTRQGGIRRGWARRRTAERPGTSVRHNNGEGRSRTKQSNGGIRVLKDSDAVFRAAIRSGVLSGDPADARYAGNCMYLFHDEDGVVWFKHRDSRACLTVPGRDPGAGGSP